MAYVPTENDRLAVRYEVGDTEAGLYILDNTTLDYVLIKNSGSISFASIDAARMILLRLSITGVDEQIDILSIKGSKNALAYKEALQLYLRNPDLNPILRSVNPYAGGISKSDIATNLADTDQNTVVSPSENKSQYTTDTNSNPFLI